MGDESREGVESAPIEEVEENSLENAKNWLKDAEAYYRTLLEDTTDESLGKHYTQQVKDYRETRDEIDKPEGVDEKWRDDVINQCDAKQKERKRYENEGKEDPLASQVMVLKPRVPMRIS